MLTNMVRFEIIDDCALWVSYQWKRVVRSWAKHHHSQRGGEGDSCWSIDTRRTKKYLLHVLLFVFSRIVFQIPKAQMLLNGLQLACVWLATRKMIGNLSISHVFGENPRYCAAHWFFNTKTSIILMIIHHRNRHIPQYSEYFINHWKPRSTHQHIALNS